MLRIRLCLPTGAKLGYSVERLADGTLHDFDDGTFKAKPGRPIADLPEDSGIFKGRYRVDLDTPADRWKDGDYCLTIHSEPNAAAGIADVVAQLWATISGGDDASVFPEPRPSVTLPPGSYPIEVGPFKGTLTVPRSQP